MIGPRVAFFTDSFLEVNGVARTSREFARYAQEHEYPFFSVHSGPETRSWTIGTLETHELKNSRFIVRLEKDLALDLLFIRHRARLLRQLRAFQPDIIHVTGPGHMGLLGAILAYQLKVPLVASWHTNLHEFGARRLRNLLRFFPEKFRRMAGNFLEEVTLDSVLWFYKFARLLFAPNPELVRMLESRTQLPTYLMQRGIDTALFSPARRKRITDEFVIGYVGRLSSEKNLRRLVELERQLVSRGICNYRFLVVGDGGDRQWLAAHLQRSLMPGVLLGTPLAEAYASMDVFVFPSETDTFGNVVLEALASGLPALVSSGGGPKYIIKPGVDGFEADGVSAFADRIMELYNDPALRDRMSRNARESAFAYSWDAVFTGVYDRYDDFLAATKPEHVRTRRAAPVFSH